MPSVRSLCSAVLAILLSACSSPGAVGGDAAPPATPDGATPATPDATPDATPAGPPWMVSSPDGTVSLAIDLDGAGVLSFTATRGGTPLLQPGRLGLRTSVGDFTGGLAFTGRSDASIDESYSLPGHKKATYRNHAREMLLRFHKDGQEIDLVARAYDDGIAFRYRLPGTGPLSVIAETTSFDLPDDASGWALGYNPAYEGYYSARPSFASGSFGMPVLARAAGQYLLLAESDIGSNYHASHLDGGAGNVLAVTWPTTVAVVTTRPWGSPWRLAVLGSPATVVESTLVENLSGPSQIADTSWIHGARAAWSWRAGAAQSDYAAHVPYVDAAAALGWDTYLVDDGWQASWVPTLVSYAAARHVGIWLWVNSGNVRTEAQARAAFMQWAAWGVQGVKADFFDGDTQATMQQYDMLARVAAEYHLELNFHGCTKPNGLERRWPNLLTQEAVFGAEQGSLAAAHNVSLVFTRNALGPMDYTPVVFSNANGVTTWGHQLALSVVFSSYVQHFSDHWAMYRDSVARAFLHLVPTTWDDTRLVEGDPAEYATIARRSGNDWYVGTIANAARTATIPLTFLPAGQRFTAHIYSDDTSASDLAYRMQTVSRDSVLSLALRAGGGAAMRISSDGAPMTTPPIYYEIVSRHSGKVLAAQNAALGDAPVIQWPYADPTTNDEWRLVDVGGGYVEVVNRWSGRVLDVSGAVTTPSAPIIQFMDRGSDNQQWQLVDAGGYSRIVNRGSGLVVDVSGASTDNGAAIVQFPWSGGDNQQWQLVQVP